MSTNRTRKFGKNVEKEFLERMLKKKVKKLESYKL